MTDAIVCTCADLSLYECDFAVRLDFFPHAYTCKKLPVPDIECSQKAFTLPLSVWAEDGAFRLISEALSQEMLMK